LNDGYARANHYQAKAGGEEVIDAVLVPTGQMQHGQNTDNG